MRFAWIALLILTLAGCATTPAYNPMQSINREELLLNQSSFKALVDGMTLDQVHKIMGDALVIGYEEQSANYKPLTIPNPYKSEAIQGTDYFIEYYIDSIRQPDGFINDSELMPLIFKNGKLSGRGWPTVNSLRHAKTP